MEELHITSQGYVALQRCRAVPLTSWVTIRQFDKLKAPLAKGAIIDRRAHEALKAWSVCNEVMILKNVQRTTTFINLMAQVFKPKPSKAGVPLYKMAIKEFDEINKFAVPRFVCEGHRLNGMKFVIDDKLWIQPGDKKAWGEYLAATYKSDEYRGDPTRKRSLLSEGAKLSYDFFRRLLDDNSCTTANDLLQGLINNVWCDPVHYFFCAISCVGEQIKKDTATLDLVAILIYCWKYGVNTARLLELPLEHTARSCDTLDLFVNPNRLGVVKLAKSKLHTSRYERYETMMKCVGAQKVTFIKNCTRATVGFLLEDMWLDSFTNDWLSGTGLEQYESKEEHKGSGTHVDEMIQVAASKAGTKTLALFSGKKCDVHAITFNANVLGGYLPQSGHGTSFLGNAKFDGIALTGNMCGPVQYKTANLVYALLKRGFDESAEVRALFLAGKFPEALRLYINQSLRDISIV